MMRLGVNIDHIATLRQARLGRYPDPVRAAVLAEIGGADNITCHLREDRRHVIDRDLPLLMDTIDLPLNLEIAATDEMVAIATKLRPAAVTLVPERREELTTEGGLDVVSFKESLKPRVASLREHGILVSIFVDADKRMIDASLEVGAEAVEIHTGGFCRKLDEALTTKAHIDALHPLKIASQFAKELGLQVHLGHGIHYQNAHWFQLVEEAEEANVGHSIIARAVFVGLEKAVSEMKKLLCNPHYAARQGAE